MNRRIAPGARLLWAFALIVSVTMAVPARADEILYDSITLRLRDEVASAQAPAPSAETRALVAAIVRNSVDTSGRTRDGAFQFKLAHPVPFLEARAAVNRLRLLPEVIYASLGPSQQALMQKSAAASGPVFLAERPITHLIVKYRDPAISAMSNRNDSLPQAQLNRLSMAAGKSVAHFRAMSGGAWVVQLSQPVMRDEALQMAQAIEADPTVEYAEPDLPADIHVAPNDPNFAVNQWDLQPPATTIAGSNLPSAWNLTKGAASIVVADIDTGILPHADLAGRTVAGYDMITSTSTSNDGDGRDADPSDPGDWTTANQCGAGSPATNSSWHGTHTAGTIGAATNNALGIAGINWVSKLQAVRVLGMCGGTFSDITDAITWAYGGSVPGVPANATPARVINMSLGGGGACLASLQAAITAANAAGTVVVVSAGNGNTITDNTTPANCNGVITVAALGRNGNRAYYSNYDDGAGATFVEIAAPGGEQSFANDPNGTLSTLNTGTTVPVSDTYIYYQGTSMAAPHVTGIVSLMLSVNSALTPGQVLAKIQSSARAFPTGTAVNRDCTANTALVTSTTKYCGAGMIDANAAVLASVARDSIGLFNPATQTFYMRVNNESGNANLAFNYGAAGDLPLTGDWDGNGTDTVGVYRPSTGFFYLRNTNTPGPADVSFQFGPIGAGIVPLVGDWNGDGVKTIGVYVVATGTFFLKNTNAGGAADITFTFGPGGAGITPVVGDWDGNGTDTVGLYVASTGAFFLKNTNAAGGADIVFTYGAGASGLMPIVGDWDNNGTKTLGLYNPTTGVFFLKNTNANGPADLAFGFGGGAGFTPLSGDWDNLP